MSALGVALVAGCGVGALVNSPADIRGVRPDSGVVVVQGIFNALGDTLLRLGPVHRYPNGSTASSQSSQNAYRLHVRWRGGNETIVAFDALVADDAGAAQHGFFSVAVQDHGPIDFIRITDRLSRQTFGRMDGRAIVH